MFHLVVLRPSRPVLALPFSKELYGVTSTLALALMLLACIRPIRRRTYELFLRTHQVLAGITLYMTWAHTRDSTSVTARYTFMSIAGVFGAACIGQLLHFLIQNRFFLCGLPRAQAVVKSNVMRVTVEVPTTFEVYPGQYINLCMPGVSLSSLFQSHPFVIVSAQREENRTILELVIEARRGWTSRLHSRIVSQSYSEAQSMREKSSYVCLFSGPHGHRRNIDRYGVVVLVASGWGVVSLLPYLQDLVQGYNSGTTKARRVHLIWQLQDAEDGRPIEDLLDQALDTDNIDQGHILQVSAYYVTGQADAELRRPGKRVTWYDGTADWEQLIHENVRACGQTPVAPSYIPTPDVVAAPNWPAFSRERPRTLVLVSATRNIRHRVQKSCQQAAWAKVRFAELEYQPDD